MKKVIILIISLIFTFPCFSQSFIGMQGTNKGVDVQLGYLSESGGAIISAGYKVPLIKANTPSVINLSVGKEWLITNNEENNYSLSSLVGIGSYKVKDFTEYDKGGQIIYINKVLPVYTLELGKDIYKGRLFVSGNYCNSFYYGLGIKAFLR